MTINAEGSKRQRILYLLAENIGKEEELDGPGPWCTGHQIEVTDLPMDQPGDNLVLIANSWNHQIYGPFIQKKPQYYAEGKMFYRKKPGVSDVYPVICNYIVEFEKVYPEMSVRRGLPWKDFVRLTSVPATSWKNLRQLELTEEEFQTVCMVLYKLNSDQTDPPITVEEAVAELKMEFLPVEEYEEDYENFVRDEFCDGDETLAEAFWESYNFDPD